MATTKPTVSINTSAVMNALKTKVVSITKTKKMNVEMGYEAPYAVIQHENLQFNHPNGGQAKYLEQPANEYLGTMRQIVVDGVTKKKKSLNDATQDALIFLLKKSQELVPVDTGELRDSAYIKVN